MRDKYENSRTKQKNKKQRFVVGTAAPPQLLPYTTKDVLTTAIYPNVGRPYNCHSPYTTWDLHTTVNHSTQLVLPLNCHHPMQHITPMQLSPILHNTGLPHNHQASSKHTAWNICGWGGGTPCALGSSLPTAHTPSKKAELGDVGRKNTAVRGTSFEFTTAWELFTKKDCFSPTRIHVSSGSRCGGL